MSKYSFFEGLLLNLEQKIGPERKRDFLTQEKAYELLKQETGKDFGYNIKEWKKWLKQEGIE
ncbi:MAG: hypothetical protein GY714_32025 [Desulfobacterales bacterium]|nr:hypothetical protein [Desulfobacterales bacterium]